MGILFIRWQQLDFGGNDRSLHTMWPIFSLNLLHNDFGEKTIINYDYEIPL